jgi:hypothetical protein
LDSVGVVLVLWLTAEHYHLPLSYHSTIVLYTNHIRLERDVVLADQHPVEFKLFGWSQHREKINAPHPTRAGDSSLTPPLLKIGELGLDPTRFLLDPGMGLTLEEEPWPEVCTC